MEKANIIAKTASNLSHLVSFGNTASYQKLSTSAEVHDNISNKTTQPKSKQMDLISNLMFTGYSLGANNLYDVSFLILFNCLFKNL